MYLLRGYMQSEISCCLLNPKCQGSSWFYKVSSWIRWAVNRDEAIIAQRTLYKVFFWKLVCYRCLLNPLGYKHCQDKSVNGILNKRQLVHLTPCLGIGIVSKFDFATK